MSYSLRLTPEERHALKWFEKDPRIDFELHRIEFKRYEIRIQNRIGFGMNEIVA